MQAKHEPSCIKAANKKRKVFDSAKQRSEGTEVTYRQIKQAQKKVNDRTCITDVKWHLLKKSKLPVNVIARLHVPVQVYSLQKLLRIICVISIFFN